VKYILALRYHEQKNYNLALKELEQITTENLTVIPYIYLPYFEDSCILDDAHMKMGEIYYDLNQKERAIQEFGQVVRFFINSDNVFKALNKLKDVLKKNP